MRKKYIILGPENQNHLPMFFNHAQGDWVERDDATLYTAAEVFCFPPWELPVGARSILDIEDKITYTPRPPHREGGEYEYAGFGH